MHAIRHLARVGAVGFLLAVGPAGCQGPKGDPGAAGEPGRAGTGCSVQDNGDGTVAVSCEDGTRVDIAGGKNGTGCTVKDNGDGSVTISCEDGTQVNITAGKNGSSCTVEDNGDGTATISCEDGTRVDIAGGKNGTGCTVKDNGNGSVTISCGDGTEAVLQGGPAGSDQVVPGVNYVAIHDPDAPAYNPDCLSCHTDQPNEASLDPDNIPGFHARKLALPVIPGDTLNKKCLYCHPTVDLSNNRSAGNLRRNVDVTRCGGCHSAGDYRFYQGL